MKNKLLFLTKMSLNKKIKTKWFLIANIIFAILVIGLVNIDFIIKSFGGDFDETQEILVIDEVGVFDDFEESLDNYAEYATDFINTEITLYDGDYDSAKVLVEEDDKILLVIRSDEINYIKAELVSNEAVGSITNTLINSSLSSIRSKIVMNKYDITDEVYADINKSVEVETIVLSDENAGDDLATSSIMQVITLPVFMLIIFLVQMIGAEVNEEKTTKSMEIIISNVSPKIHFLSKIISANLFVIIQGALLIIFAVLAILVRFILGNGSIVGELGSEIEQVTSTLSLAGVTDTLSYMLPIMLVMLLLTFFAYSLLAGILASMTTNLEDFQQLQTPIVIVSLVGYYLSIMAGIFKGSLFIKIMCYVPFISSMLAPTMYVMGQITLFDLIGSILLLILVIWLLIKYGLRIYKVGILNYSQTGLWKKMLKAMKEK